MALDGAAQRLVTSGHEVVVHGRDQQRAQEAPRGVPGARSALAGDLASLEQTRALADQANATVIVESDCLHERVIFPSARMNVDRGPGPADTDARRINGCRQPGETLSPDAGDSRAEGSKCG